MECSAFREVIFVKYIRVGASKQSKTDFSKIMYLGDSFQKLQEILSKGEKILCLGKLCNRLETQDERSLPIGYVLPSEKFISKEEEDEMLDLLKKEQAEVTNINQLFFSFLTHSVEWYYYG